jgi:hypothetical protein
MRDGPSFQKPTQNLLLQHPTKPSRIRQSRLQLEDSQRNHRKIAQLLDLTSELFPGKHHSIRIQRAKQPAGATFDRDAMTAAHRTLPFGTRVRVTDLASTKSVIVRIVDRGPWIRDRVLDLSLGAARTLGITERGVAQVRIEVL